MEEANALNEDFNLSTTQSTTVLELAERIWRHMRPDKPFRVVHDPPFEHDVQRRIPATDKARNLLGFEATTTLDKMLEQVIPWVVAAVESGRI